MGQIKVALCIIWEKENINKSTKVEVFTSKTFPVEKILLCTRLSLIERRCLLAHFNYLWGYMQHGRHADG